MAQQQHCACATEIISRNDDNGNVVLLKDQLS